MPDGSLKLRDQGHAAKAASGADTMPDGSLKLRGRVIAVLGDNIDTDIIYPGRYLNITDRDKTAEHLFELAYPEMRASLEPGGIVIAGKNFGCGSSREQAASALKYSGVGAVIAASFGRIFLRNAINLGLPAVVSQQAAEACAAGEELEIHLAAGEIRNVTRRLLIPAAALDPRAVELLAAGGLIPYLKRKYVA